MKIKKLAVISAYLGLIFASTAAFAHGHHNGGHHSGYSYNYDYDSGHHAGHNNCINNDYDCSSHPDHAHVDGVCPYYCTDPSYKCYKASTVKKVQSKLNNAGYKCGSANGIYNAKTKKAIKKFQKSKNMSANGKITKKLLNKLDL